MEVTNVLTKKKQVISIDEVVSLQRRDSDFILSVPHSGLFIPSEFKDNYNIGRSLLIGTDLYTDELFDCGTRVVTKLNPYFLNMARSLSKERCLPAHLQSGPFKYGSLTGETIMKHGYSFHEEKRILEHYKKYHRLLKRVIDEMVRDNGYALIFDCHSLNSVGLKNIPDSGKQRADFIIGNVDDTSADPAITRAMVKSLSSWDKGYKVKVNDPYKGGFITRNYSDPNNKIHVIQLEVKKSLYMDESLEKGKFEKNWEFHNIKEVVFEALKDCSEKAKELFG